MAMLNRFAFDSFTDFQKSLSLYQLTKTFSLVYLGIYTHAIFFILGISILLYLTFKKQDKRLLMLIILISLVPIFTLNQFYLAKYLITSLLLFFIIGGYLEEHKTNKRVKLVLVAFILLLVGNVALIFTAENFLFYILGNLLEFIAYSIVLIDLMIIIRKKPSKKIP